MAENRNKLRQQINRSVPYAPESPAEVGQRLSSASQRLNPDRNPTRSPTHIAPVPETEDAHEVALEQPASDIGEVSLIARPRNISEAGNSFSAPSRSETIPHLANAAKTAAIHKNLLAARETVRKVHERLTALRYSSDNEGVKATVDGHGSLLELRIRRPARVHRLGGSVANALIVARSKVEGASDLGLIDEIFSREAYDEITELVIAAPERGDFGTLDRTESVESRDIVAQEMERQRRLLEIAEQMDRMRITVDSEAIRVIRGRDAKTLEVQISQQLIRDIGLERVADRTLRAINKADKLARAEKMNHFNVIQMYDFNSDPRTIEVLKLVLGDGGDGPQ